MSFVGARQGLVRLVDDTGGLLLVAHHGFDRSFVLSMRRLTLAAGMPSARAAASKMTVVIPDVRDDRSFGPYSEVSELGDFRAIMATPLVAHAGACVGVVSLHFEKPHTPTAIEQSMLETYGKIAADRIVALLGPGPRSLRAQQLFERALASTTDVRTRGLLGAALETVTALYYRRMGSYPPYPEPANGRRRNAGEF
jgi:hypothetical protein